MWHIQKDIFGAYEERRLKEALDNLNILHCDCVDNQVVSVPKGWEQKSTPVFRGSVEFIQPMRHKYINTFRRNCPVGVTIDNYNCSRYYQYWSNWMLNKRHFFVPWGILRYWASDYFDWLESDKLFIRPNSGRKIFTGNYITKRWWPGDIETIASLPGNTPSDEDMVLVSRHRGISAEYRVMMHWDKVVSYSRYDDNENAQTIERDDLVQYCECAAWSANFFPDDYFTIDVAVLQDGDLAVIELNSLFSAGWYDADYEAIIKHVSENF